MPGLSRKRGLNFAGVKRTNLINFIFRESKLSADPGFIKSGFEQLGPGARFSKVPKLFGRISGDNSLCIFKTKASRGTKLCNYFKLYSLYNISKDQLYRISGSQF